MESEVYNYFRDDKIKIRKLSDTSLISYSFWAFFEKKGNIFMTTFECIADDLLIEVSLNIFIFLSTKLFHPHNTN